MSRNRQVRFSYGGSWTKWYGDNDDLSFLHNLAIDAMETTDLMSKAEALEFLKEHEAEHR